MIPASDTPPDYPTVRLLVRHGHSLAVALGVAPVVAAVAAGILGAAWWWVVILLAAAPVAYLFCRSYVELVRIIADTLLPR